MDALHPVVGLLLALLCRVYAESSPMERCQTATIFGLKTADCYGLGLVDLPRTLDRDVKVLKFAENRLQLLAADQFRSYPTLQEIYLARNRISSIAAGAFRGLLSLQKVDLEANQLSHVHYDFLADARSVRVLNFRFNPIAIVELGALSNLANLEEISLERCRLTSIDARTFEGLDRLVSINLADNDIAELSPEMERYLPAGLRVFRFYRNPWRCDCRLRWLRVWTATRSGPGGTDQEGGVNWDFSRNTPTCASPRLLRGVSWKLLDADQFACAAQIVVNSSTSVRLTPGSNASIECVIVGDPEPTVTWYKDSMEVDGALIEAYRDENFTGGLLYSPLASTLIPTRVYITLNEVTPGHTGDYRCVAQNSAGRSEVTFKVWMDSANGFGPQSRDINSSIGSGNAPQTVRLEVAIGLVIGAGCIVLATILFAVVFCLVKRHRRFRQHSYHVRDNQGSNNYSSTISGKNDCSRISKKKHETTRESRQFLRLPLCLRSSTNSAVVSENLRSCGTQEADDEDTYSVEGGIGFELLLHRSDDEEVDKVATSTLQPLIEVKDTTISQSDNLITNRQSCSDLSVENNSMKKVGDDCSEEDNSFFTAPSFGERTDRVQVPSNASAVYETNLDDNESSCTTCIVQEPDLLIAGGRPMNGLQLRSLFRGGDVTASSPFRQTRSSSNGSNTTKVSFAIDRYKKDDADKSKCEASQTSVLSSLSARCRNEENEYVVRVSGSDKIRSSNEYEDYTLPYAIHGGGIISQLQPVAVSLTTSPAMNNTSETPFDLGSAAQTGSLGRRVRNKLTSCSPSKVVGNCLAFPSGYCNYTMPRNNLRSTRPSAFSLKSRLPPVFENSSRMAVPSAIVGVTEGLVMEPQFTRSTSVIARSSASTSLSSVPQGPMKPIRFYEWHTSNREPNLACHTAAEQQHREVPSVRAETSLRETSKRAQLPESTYQLAQPQNNSFGTAV